MAAPAGIEYLGWRAIREARVDVANGENREGSLIMEDRKNLIAAAGAGAASLFGFASASAQDDGADDDGDDAASASSVSDEFDGAFGAFEESFGGDDDADDGGDDDADDDGGDDDGDDTEIGDDDDDSEGLAIADASGGDNNFAFVS